MGEILVVGFGSIGARHARIAHEDGHGVTVVSRRGRAAGFLSFTTIAAALEGEHRFGCAIIASETSQHRADLDALLAGGFRGRVLVEKPIFSVSGEAREIGEAFRQQVRVAYNLRFHPLLIALRNRVQAAGRILNVVVHVGQDLRQWRTGRAVEHTYSSRKSEGGGALRDLSHELDYLVWLFGPWRSVCASGGRIGDLPGDADDCWGILLNFECGARVTLAMDYFCHRPVRTITVNTPDDTIQVDLVRGSLVDAEGEMRVESDRDFTYRSQLRALVGDPSTLGDFDQGLAVLKLIEAIEDSAESGMVVVR